MAIQQGVEQHRIVSFVNDEWRRHKDARAIKEEKWIECIYAYLSKFQEVWAKAAKGRSQRFLGVSFDACENVYAQINRALFPNDNWFELLGVGPEDEKYAKAMTLFMRHQHEGMMFRPTWKQIGKQLVVLGSAPYGVRWRTEYVIDNEPYADAMQRWMQRNQQQWQDYQQARAQYRLEAVAAVQAGMQAPPAPNFRPPDKPPKKYTIKYDGPDLEAGDLFEFIIDDTTDDLRTALRMSRNHKRLAELKKLSVPNDSGYAVYENVALVTEARTRSEKSDGYREQRKAIFGLNVDDVDSVQLVEAWGTFDLPSPTGYGTIRYENYVATVANENRLLRFEPSPLWTRDLPKQLATLIPVPGEAYGLGIVESALGTQDLLNVRANQLVDAMAYIVHPEMKAYDDGIIDLDTPTSRPGKIWQLGDLNNLIPIEKNLNGVQLTMQEIGLLKNEFQEIAGVTRFPSQREGQTATEVAASSSQMQGRFAEMVQHIEDTCIKPILSLQLAMDQQYLETDQVVRVIGDDGLPVFEEISPEAIRRQYDVRPVGSRTVALEELKKQQLIQFYSMIVPNGALWQPQPSMDPMQPPAPPPIDIVALSRKIYEEFGFRDAENIFKGSPPPLELGPGEYGAASGGAGSPEKPSEQSGAAVAGEALRIQNGPLTNVG